MSNVNVVILKEDIGIQMFDGLYAYLKSKNTNIKLVITESFDPTADVNIFYTSMPAERVDVDKFDIVLLSNAGEATNIATDVIRDQLSNKNTYLITNAFLDKSHKLYNKVLCWPDAFTQTKNYWCLPFYNFYFENNINKTECSRKNTVAQIQGANRTVRHNFFKSLKDMKSINNIGKLDNTLINTTPGYFESNEDEKFRKELEKLHPEVYDTFNNEDYVYYEEVECHGIDGQFGRIPPGYKVLKEYFETSCVVYPETSWKNSELAITEKGLKCFYAECLPFPIGGAYTNKIYNDLGFYTAYNLLPETLQKFDSELDHFKRHSMALKGLRYLCNNLDIFGSKEFKQYTTSNKINFHTKSVEFNGIEKLHEVLESKL